MASDALMSAGVVAAGLVILMTNWLWVDPVVSLGINGVIAWGTLGLLRDSVSMSKDLAQGFKINHSTVQIEVDPHIACALASDEVV